MLCRSETATNAQHRANGFDRYSCRRFTVLCRSQTATNNQHRTNGFVGYFLVFSQQIAHRAKYGETGCKSGCSHRKTEVFFVFINVIVLIIIYVLVQIFGIGGVKVIIVFCLMILFLRILPAALISERNQIVEH